MRWAALIISMFLVYGSFAATEETSFEKSFQKIGKKLDEAKAKGKELGQEAKKELKAAGEKAAAETKEARGDWKQRLKGAFSELGSGIKNAWRKLAGDE